MPLCLNQHCLTQLFCCLDVLRGRAGDCRVFCLLPECTAESVQLGDIDLISVVFCFFFPASAIGLFAYIQ